MISQRQKLIERKENNKRQYFNDFVENKSAFVKAIIGMVVLFLVASAVIGTVATNSQDAENKSATDDKTDAIIDLWPFIMAIAILLMGLKYA